VRQLAEAAHRDLHTRVEQLMQRECQRYLDMLERSAVTPGAAKQLLDVVRDVEVARWTGVQQ
jgi:hypothetical protein